MQERGGGMGPSRTKAARVRCDVSWGKTVSLYDKWSPGQEMEVSHKAIKTWRLPRALHNSRATDLIYTFCLFCPCSFTLLYQPDE